MEISVLPLRLRMEAFRMSGNIEDYYIQLPDPDDIPVEEATEQLLEDFER